MIVIVICVDVRACQGRCMCGCGCRCSYICRGLISTPIIEARLVQSDSVTSARIVKVRDGVGDRC